MGFDQTSYTALLLGLSETPASVVFQHLNSIESTNEPELCESNL